MGHTISVDTAALRAVAQEFDAAADAVDDVVRHHLRPLAFGGADGGRDHAVAASDIRDALTRLTSGTAAWSRACSEIAVALRDGATRYAEAEAAGSDRLS